MRYSVSGAGDKPVDKAVDKPVGNAGYMTQPTVLTDHVFGYRRAKVALGHVGPPRMFHVKRSINTGGPICSGALGGQAVGLSRRIGSLGIDSLRNFAGSSSGWARQILGAQLFGPSAHDGSTCDTAHGRLLVIHRATQGTVDKPVDFAVDKTVNNVMVSLSTSVRDGPLLASWSVILCSAGASDQVWERLQSPIPSRPPIDAWSNEKA
jgi:hypothetical protein